MLGHVEMDDFPSCLRQHDQHEEDLEPGRGHGEEIEGNEIRNVVIQEGPPARRAWGSIANEILLDRGFRHRNAQLPQFA
jgi:hypothetical protein